MKKTLISLFILFCFTLPPTGILCAETPDFGDDYTTAHSLTTDGTIVEGILEDTADEDWFSFTTTADGLYSVTVSTLSGTKYIGVYSLDGTPVVINPPNIFSTSGSISKTFYLPDAGTYYIRVYSTYNAGVYLVSVDETGIYPPDSFSDSCLSPEPLVVGDPPIAGTIGPLSVDEDWFSFSTTALHKYEIHINRADNTNSTYYELYETGCGEKIRSNTSSSTITIMSWYGESYDLRLHTTDSKNGWYEIEVVDLGAFSDDHGNAYTDATAISTTGIEASGALEYTATYNQDEDWFSFESTANGLYQIDVTAVSGSKYYYLYRLESGGQLTQLLLLSGTKSEIIWLPDAETYYLKVSQGGLGAYTVRVEEIDIIPPDAYPDTCAGVPDPHEIVVDAPATIGTISSATDNDWFTFEGQKLHLYEITLVGDAGGGTLYFDLYEDCSTLIRPNQTNMEFVPIIDTQPYYLRVFSNGSTRYYELQITDSGLQSDDHGNSADDATEILPNGYSYPGSLEYNVTLYDDEDWFVFTALHDSTYDVTLNSQSSTKGIRIYEEQPDLSLVQIFSGTTYTSRTDPISVLGQRKYYIQIYLGSLGSYTVSVQGPDPICGDLAHPFPTYDYNLDCYVNLIDFALFAAEWLNCTDPAPPCEYNP